MSRHKREFDHWENTDQYKLDVWLDSHNFELVNEATISSSGHYAFDKPGSTGGL